MKRLSNIFGIVLTAALLSAGVAAAASLGLTSGQLSAGSASVTACTSSPLLAIRNVDNGGTVTQVNVLSVPQACAGETLSVTLVALGGGGMATSSAPVGTCSGGCTVTITGFGATPAASVRSYAFSLTGG